MIERATADASTINQERWAAIQRACAAGWPLIFAYPIDAEGRCSCGDPACWDAYTRRLVPESSHAPKSIAPWFEACPEAIVLLDLAATRVPRLIALYVDVRQGPIEWGTAVYRPTRAPPIGARPESQCGYILYPVADDVLIARQEVTWA